jgi:NarL family two-component system response regulator LiaR
MTAIYADDSVIMRGRLNQYLKMAGCKIVGCATSARSASQLCEELKPDLAVLDVIMVPGSGKDVALDLKQRGVVKNVLVITSNSQDSTIKPLRAAGVRTLTKPISAEQIAAEIEYIQSQQV